MTSCLVCGCGTPLTQPARNKPAYVQLKLPRTVSGVQRCAALAGRKSRSGSKRSRNETLSVSCAASPGALSPEDQAINEQIDKAARMLNSMMEEIHQEAFVSGAVSEVTGQAPEVTEAEAIRKAVASRMDQLDEAFLMALGAYIGAAEEQGDKALAGRLSRIQQQVLQDVSKRLPPEMQILDIVLRLLSRNERMSVLRQAASGQGGDDVPPCDIKRVRGAALQLVSDMEEKDAIPDRRLLARLCIAREEIAEVVAEQQYANRSGSTQDMYENNMALHNQSVPKASIAFLKELLTMSDEAKRKAFLQKAFREEFEPGAQSQKADSQHASSSSVRPGSFLTCVTATQVQMQSMKGAESTLAKLETIRREALQALQSIAA
ncbi:hypothetical protein WJX82_003763 [Trebouxia sp. C0006]